VVRLPTILITKPRFDEATHYLSSWSKPVIDIAEKKGFQIHKLEEKKCTKKEFEKRIRKHAPKLVLFNGHGSYTTVTGQNFETLVEIEKNEHLLKNRIVHAFACSSANLLGPSSINKGAIAYIGFKEDFVFLQDDTYSANPMKDKIAKHFLESTNLAPISIIKGNTIEEAFQRSQEAFEKSIQFFETHYDTKNSHILFWLRYDKMIHTYCGDGNSKIE
jgi:hypothetical protein